MVVKFGEHGTVRGEFAVRQMPPASARRRLDWGGGALGFRA